MSGKVVLLGAGPGQWGLLTLKGADILKKADCVIYDRLLNKDFLRLAKPECEKIFVGKKNHFHVLSQDEINQLLLNKALEHKLVVRLKGGDPYVFGRGGEEALFLMENGIAVETVPGVSSTAAALSTAGIPITHRGLSKGFKVVTAHSKRDGMSNIDFCDFLDETITYVFLMGLSHVGEIAKGLIDAGRDSATEVAVISQGTTNRQRKCVGNLENIEALVNDAGLTSPSIIVVGSVVSLADTLNFFEKRPLFGKSYFFPQIEGIAPELCNPLEAALTELGAEVISVIAGRITPIEVDLGFLESTCQGDIIVFTSANGVKAFLYNLMEISNMDLRAICKFQFAVIGQKTYDTLKVYGIKADIISDKQNGTDLAKVINNKVAENVNIYLLCAKETSGDFEEALDDRFNLTKVVCYENVVSDVEIDVDIIKDISECDGAIFTSASNVRFATDRLDGRLPDRIYSIGPAVTRTLNEIGYNDILQSEISSYDGLVKLLVEKATK